MTALRPRLAAWLVAFVARHPRADPRPALGWADTILQPAGADLLAVAAQLAARPEPLARWYAGRALGWLGPEHADAAWGLLRQLAADPARLAREGAHIGAAAAARCGSGAWSRLEAWMEDPCVRVRRAAVIACLPHLTADAEARADARGEARAAALLARADGDPRLRSLTRVVRARAESQG